MKSFVGVALAFFLLWGRTQGLGINMETPDEDEARLQEENRLILLANGAFNTGGSGFNLSQLLPLLALAAATLLPLLCLCALTLILLYHKSDKGYDSYGSHGHSSYRSALGVDDLDWEKLSIIDWVSVGEETFSKYDPTNLNCPTRLICELHQNAKEFGKLGQSFVHVFGYLKYLELFSFPDVLKDLVQELTDAADRGRSLNKDCGDIYSDCNFSIKGMYDKYSVNEIH